MRGAQGFSTAWVCVEFSTVPTAFSTERLDLLDFLALFLHFFCGKVLRYGKAGSFPQVVESFVERKRRSEKNHASVKVLNLHISAKNRTKPLDNPGDLLN